MSLLDAWFAGVFATPFGDKISQVLADIREADEAAGEDPPPNEPWADVPREVERDGH